MAGIGCSKYLGSYYYLCKYDLLKNTQFLRRDSFLEFKMFLLILCEIHKVFKLDWSQPINDYKWLTHCLSKIYRSVGKYDFDRVFVY